MLILGSCVALNLKYSGCCDYYQSPPCSSNGCYCDRRCFTANDCCKDIADIGCYPASLSSSIVSPTPTDTPGKTKLERHAIHLSQIFLAI